MIWNFRKITPSKSFSTKYKAQATRKIKRKINPSYGKKGTGFIRNPKKAIYDYGYHRHTVGWNGASKHSRKKRTSPRSSSKPIKLTKKQQDAIWYIFAVGLLCTLIYVILRYSIVIGGIGYCIYKTRRFYQGKQINRKQAVMLEVSLWILGVLMLIDTTNTLFIE